MIAVLLLILIGDGSKHARRYRNLLIDWISTGADTLKDDVTLTQVQVLILIRHYNRLALHGHSARHKNLIKLLLLRLLVLLRLLKRWLLLGERDRLATLILDVLNVQERRLLR